MKPTLITCYLTDAEDPQIICVEDLVKQTDDGLPTAMVAWEKLTATDNSGNVSDVICNPPSGTNFTIGQTVVTCEVVDRSVNRAVCHFNVNIRGKIILFYSKANKQFRVISIC